ncbi:hypothetical protein CASFOL_013046 [Castilleja foliolosa]|uniref:Chloride channel protein n=1 Tax=Castilleja foliolosa TaxID=1961234 RepID=A0ABD3DIU6_9LAMI
MHFRLTLRTTTFTTASANINHNGYRINPSPSSSASSDYYCHRNSSTRLNSFLSNRHYLSRNIDNHGRRPRFCHAKGNELIQDEPVIINDEPNDDDEDQSSQFLQQLGDSAILPACFVGLFTGIAVVLFNYAVHEIRDLCWDGIPDRGASWLREEPIESKWGRVIFVPAFGGLIVSLLNTISTAVENGAFTPTIQSALKPILKTVAACVTLGTGNSLGPEGPSVEIGVSVAKGVGSFLDKGAQRKLSLRAAGSAAGISSGFNAAVGGCFFAVESVLWPSPTESSLSLTNTTSMVILSAVIASVISEIGLGSEPAFAVPIYDFRSPSVSELPLYLLLGILCGLVSLGLSKSTSFMLAFVDGVERTVGIPKSVSPIFGGLTVGIIALAYPEILYWGFQNVDTLLESRPFSNSLSAALLVQLVAVKIVSTSLCRATGLVGGYYAPSLFIGAATGMAYGKIVGYFVSISNPILHLSFLEVASPQAYGLVGMAATLAGVCQVPLTSVLLLFELTQDYRIVLPLLGAVGLSSWIASDKTRKGPTSNIGKSKEATSSQSNPYVSTVSLASPDAKERKESGICELESSLCMNDDSDDDDVENLANEIMVSEAMRTNYVTALMSTTLTDVMSHMLEEKQSCAVIVDVNDCIIGQITLNDIQQFIELSRAKNRKTQVVRVSELCSSYGKRCCVSWTATPNMSLLTALSLMNRRNINQLPVVLEDGDYGGCPVGLLDRESIDLACSVIHQEGSRHLMIAKVLQETIMDTATGTVA